MGEYDESKDKVLDTRDLVNDDSKGGMQVMLCQYDGGDIKIQFQPYYINKEGKAQYTKAKRIKLSLWDNINSAVLDMQDSLNKKL